jgi:hypothetical protein
MHAIPRAFTSACTCVGLALLYGDFEILSEQHILVRFSEGRRDRARARRHVHYQRRTVPGARVATPEDDLPHLPFHHRMIPGKRSKRNLDPSRAVAFDAVGTGTPAGDRDDRAVLQGSVGVACWQTAAAGGEFGCDIRCCGSGVLDRSACRGRKPLGSLDHGRIFAEESLHREPQPCVIAGGTGQRQWSRVRLEPALFGLPLDGCRTRNPAALTAGFHLFPAWRQDTSPQHSWSDDRTDDCAFGAMMSLALRQKSRKLRFQMIGGSRTPIRVCSRLCFDTAAQGTLRDTATAMRTGWRERQRMQPVGAGCRNTMWRRQGKNAPTNRGMAGRMACATKMSHIMSHT